MGILPLLRITSQIYVILIALVRIGFQATNTRIVSLLRLTIVPAIFTVMSVHTLTSSFQLNAFSITLWNVSIATGILLGFWQIYRIPLQTDKPHFLIRVPGTWTTLMPIVIIFAAKYYFAYELASDAALWLSKRVLSLLCSPSPAFVPAYLSADCCVTAIDCSRTTVSI